MISSYIIPLITIFIIIYALVKKVDIFDTFIIGLKEGLKMSLNIFPTIFAFTLSINVLLKSNLIIDISNYFKPILDILRIPNNLLPIMIMRPISGSSSLIIMNDLFVAYGVDSFISRVASVIQGSTDTTIYIIGLYFGSIGIKKIKYSLFVGLITDFICILIAIITVSIFFT